MSAALVASSPAQTAPAGSGPKHPALPSERNVPHAWGILAIVLGVSTMDVVDVTIVNVAVPSISRDLDAGNTAVQWIVGGYALSFALALIVGGRLGDIYGRKNMWRAGTLAFTLTSLACALAVSSEMLIATRLLQGLAAAWMIPQGFGLIRESFGARDLFRALAFWGPSASIGSLLGPLIGGALIALDPLGTGWRSIFFVNIPIGLATVWLGGRWIADRPPRHEDAPGLDLVGATIMAITVGLFFFPLIQGRELGWPAWTFMLFAAGAVALMVFLAVERRRKAAGKVTLIVTSIFSKRAYVGGALLLGLLFIAMAGLLIVTTIYLQDDQGFSALQTGLATFPMPLGVAINSLWSGHVLLDRFGRNSLHTGAGLLFAGFLALVLVLGASGEDIAIWQLLGPFFAVGLGFGLLVSPAWGFATNAIDHHEIGSASGVLNSLQQLGTALGVAGIGTIFFAIADNSGMPVAAQRCCIVLTVIAVAIAGLIFLLPRYRLRPDQG